MHTEFSIFGQAEQQWHYGQYGHIYVDKYDLAYIVIWPYSLSISYLKDYRNNYDVLWLEKMNTGQATR
jgi:hypothetical protein